ncbi:trypsin-like peptidase domain-containing protein [uncultured Paludibaculum sp.]|uniref:trypsin-like peptidase domain-containing protein n=1 Tax=uncultured Paludibaculum sp. TaxID=1765020 RepID=UPI002AABE9F7|nr:trypsin-like peptidase domain-containing protein [uncultured Paludibaculum sp.]
MLTKLILGAVATSLLLLAQTQPQPVAAGGEFAALSGSFQGLSRRVHTSVVKVTAVGYRQLEGDETDEPGVAARQQSSGSGVIIDESGFIVTNAHVVIGAQRVQVSLPTTVESNSGTRRSAVRPTGRIMRAELVGLDLETDVALLKVNERGLPALRLADSDTVEQGQLVLAFGSPMGLDNSVTMGVVSSPARQLKPDDPMIYIQTDAPINPGNSGGPLVDSSGNVVGINTLILTQSGGSEGIGFAVPSNIVANVVDQIRKSGRVVRGEIGVTAQTISPSLAEGLKLGQNWGVVIGDVEPEGEGEKAGLRVGDIIYSLNGKIMENARQFNINVYRPAIGETVNLEIVRGKRRLAVTVKVVERHDEATTYAELASREENLVSELGIFVVDLTPKLREQVEPIRRETGGLLVAARHADGPLLEDGFKAGDVIYSINGSNVSSVAALRQLLRKMKSADPIAVQIERAGKLRFVSFELP